LDAAVCHRDNDNAVVANDVSVDPALVDDRAVMSVRLVLAFSVFEVGPSDGNTAAGRRVDNDYVLYPEVVTISDI
jgi:hypothetical protein